ncbi:pseudouridine synthase [Commensalibacter melissae]|uniref:Pseudouridine synthase n=1 Tax=Commensalibacter melissae TaxID=2070537 RepID=A0A318MVZ2_9PROT|nr:MULTISPECIES: pseudouridine synthase [Commensalibacter]MUG35249.1 pseudouridine synthase [Commensalibacter sp. ESL0382]MUH05285.1 pseudouridine synthase [Commensalibacter melissae]PXZ00204.1 pseudouridine synthase [Commensalibacter melissae]QGT69257.1 pseudouridine synthase [Commensalibacter melissae]
MPKTDPDSPNLSFSKGERIAKWLARAGVASRRDAEKLVSEGKVFINQQQITQPATFVSNNDNVYVNGKLIAYPEHSRLWRYHKPVGLITTHKDPEGRPTVFDALPPNMPRVISVGRLDLNSEGLLLLTNDGSLARQLELPSNHWVRRYRVRVFGHIVQAKLDQLKDGITVEGIHYSPIIAKIDSQKGMNAWLTVSLQEGRNREIRRVMQHFDLQVNRLIRIAYGPFQLGSLPKNSLDEVSGKVIREQTGKHIPLSRNK